jgi:hypothetical protein
MTAKMHRIHMPGVGEAMALIDGGTPYTIDTVQKYPLGTLIRMGGRTYAYAKASGTLNPAFGALVGSVQHIAQCAIETSAAAGVTELVLHTAVNDGAAHDGVIAADEMVGGYILVFPSGNADCFIRQITSNTVCLSGIGSLCTIGLDSPTPVAVVATTSVAEAMASPYLNVKSGTDALSSVVGIPTVAATTGKYCWLQTWGPCWAAPSSDAGTGNSVRQLIFGQNGSIDTHDHTGGNYSAQHAGFCLANAYGGGQGAPFFFLQITP